MRLTPFAFGLLAALPAVVSGQSLSFVDYEPRSTLVVPEHHPQRARFPFVDIHSHYDGQAFFDDTLSPSNAHGVTTVILGVCGIGWLGGDAGWVGVCGNAGG